MRKAIVVLLLVLTGWTQQRATHCAAAPAGSVGSDAGGTAAAGTAHMHHGPAGAARTGPADTASPVPAPDRGESGCQLLMRCTLAVPSGRIVTLEAGQISPGVEIASSPAIPSTTRLTSDPPPPRLPD
jgi:hypothetical protein